MPEDDYVPKNILLTGGAGTAAVSIGEKMTGVG